MVDNSKEFWNNEFVLNVVIDRRYLSEEQLELLEQEPIEIEIEDPF